MDSNLKLTLPKRSWAIPVLICCVAVFPSTADAQSPGQDAVYPASGICCRPSPAFIDASQFGGSNTDICKVLNHILNPVSGILPASGAVIDARGLPGTTGTSMTCSMSPWGSGNNTVTLPSTVLLPATGGSTPTPIIISTPWILPANTHLIGEGDANPVSATNPATTIQAASGFSGAIWSTVSPPAPASRSKI
jgi:hypothetical protein